VAALQAQIEALKQELATSSVAGAPAAAPAPAPAEPPPTYSQAEQDALAKYREEWPDIANGEALARRAEYQQLVQWVFGQIQPHLDALRQQSGQTFERTQYSSLKELVPDYDDVRDPTLAWIATQPAYLKDAYQKVANEGTPQDVADLIGRFRKETGWVKAGAAPASAPAAASTPAPAAQAPAPAAPAPAPVNPAVAAAAAALKPVAGSRSQPAAAADPNDFDGAFAEATQALSK